MDFRRPIPVSEWEQPDRDCAGQSTDWRAGPQQRNSVQDEWQASSQIEISIPQNPLPNRPNVTSNFSRDAYLQSVNRVIEYIRAGDIFQANLSQRLLARQTCNSLEQYRRLRRCNPAPFAAYFSFDDWSVLSASPERFVFGSRE